MDSSQEGRLVSATGLHMHMYTHATHACALKHAYYTQHKCKKTRTKAVEKVSAAMDISAVIVLDAAESGRRQTSPFLGSG